jgi:hypothetical protein
MLVRRLVGLEADREEIKFMLLSCLQNTGQNHSIKQLTYVFTNVAQFRYLGRTMINQNLFKDGIKRSFKSCNAGYHSAQNLFSSGLLFKNVKITIHKTIILPVVLYGYKTWSLTWMVEHRLRVFENRVLRWIYLFTFRKSEYSFIPLDMEQVKYIQLKSV